MTAIGTRRPREGRCERCEKPLTDLVWETWESIAPFASARDLIEGLAAEATDGP